MDISKKLLTLLALFCVIASAGVVCAEDVSDGGYAGIQYNDSGGWAGSQYQDDKGGWAGSQYNATVENAAAHPTTVSAGNQVVNNTTANTTTNHLMHAAGNPILALLAVSAVLGGYAVIKRK